MRVGRRCAGNDLLEANAVAVVTELRRHATQRRADQAVGAISPQVPLAFCGITIQRAAIVDEVAVVVPRMCSSSTWPKRNEFMAIPKI